MKMFHMRHWHMVSVAEKDTNRVVRFLNENHVTVHAVYFEDSATTLEFKCTDTEWDYFKANVAFHASKMIADFTFC